MILLFITCILHYIYIYIYYINVYIYIYMYVFISYHAEGNI